VGIDQSSEMAEIATARGYACHVGNIVDLEIEGKFDACIALFHVISYINSNEDLIKLFKKTRSNLKENGIFVFDVWFTPAVLYQMPEVRVKRVADDEVSVTRIAEPSLDFVKNIVNVNYRIFVKNKMDGLYEEFTETHIMRHFGYPEIDLLATQTGFSVIKAEEFLTGKEPSIHTWGVNFVLQAH
jgi:SAM-dependent methyltransferase